MDASNNKGPLRKENHSNEMGEKYVIPPITVREPKFDIRKEKERLQRTLRNTIGEYVDGKRSMNILITGAVGVGKSSISNSMIAAMPDSTDARYIEYFETGTFIQGDQVTLSTQRMTKYDYCSNRDDMEKCWPRFLDAAGFQNEDSQDTREILALLVNGYIPINENLQKVRIYLKENSPEALRNKYATYDESLRIDRIVFVAASDEELPDKLISCVTDVATGRHKKYSTRRIPMFGILTKFDKVKTENMKEFREREEQFKLLLGLRGTNRYCSCSNYCEDTSKGEPISVKPEIDVPLLKILIQVCSPSITSELGVTALRNANKETQTIGKEKTWLSLPSGLRWVVFTLKGLLIALLVAWYLKSYIPGKELNEDCTLYTGGVELNKICKAQKEFRIIFFIYPSYTHIVVVVVFYIILELIMMIC